MYVDGLAPRSTRRSLDVRLQPLKQFKFMFKKFHSPAVGHDLSCSRERNAFVRAKTRKRSQTDPFSHNCGGEQ